MEWLNGPETDENMEVDIGFIPQMEIQITSPSKKVPKDIQEKELPEDKNMAKNVQNMKWKKEISMYDAERTLEIAFYPFKKVRYMYIKPLFLTMWSDLCFVGFHIINNLLTCICQFNNVLC